MPATPRAQLPGPASEQEVQQLATQIQAGLVLCHADIPVDLALMVFLPVSLGALKGWSEDEVAKIVVFGVRGVHAIAPLTANGYPIFLEVGIWLIEDYLRACRLVLEAVAGGS